MLTLDDAPAMGGFFFEEEVDRPDPQELVGKQMTPAEFGGGRPPGAGDPGEPAGGQSRLRRRAGASVSRAAGLQRRAGVRHHARRGDWQARQPAAVRIHGGDRQEESAQAHQEGGQGVEKDGGIARHRRAGAY